jgi:hypothetical protein
MGALTILWMDLHVDVLSTSMGSMLCTDTQKLSRLPSGLISED